MSFDSAIFAIVLFVLPGFFFLVGFYGLSRCQRDATPKSRLSELATVFFIAFIVHGVLLACMHGLGWSAPSAVRTGTASAMPEFFLSFIEQVAGGEAFSRHLYLYVVASGVLGLVLGMVLIWWWENGNRGTEPDFESSRMPEKPDIVDFVRWLAFWLYDRPAWVRHNVTLFHGWAKDLLLGDPRPLVRVGVVCREPVLTEGDTTKLVTYLGILEYLAMDHDYQVQSLVIVNGTRAVMALDEFGERAADVFLNGDKDDGESDPVPGDGAAATSREPGTGGSRDHLIFVPGSNILDIQFFKVTSREPQAAEIDEIQKHIHRGQTGRG